MSNMLKELPSIKNARKPARELWEAVVSIYSTNAQHKRTSSGRESAMYRDSQLGILPRDFFKQFMQKIKVDSILILTDRVTYKTCSIKKIRWLD